MKKSSMDLSKIANGALQEKFSEAFAKVLENLTDPNTPFKDKRNIQCQLTFTQNETRDDVKCTISVKTKLAPVQPVVTSFGVFKNLEDGTVSAEEYGSQLRGQTKMPNYPEKKVVSLN